jgi:ferric-dicitrate binding protein FerR (iron transport regulator)
MKISQKMLVLMAAFWLAGASITARADDSAPADTGSDSAAEAVAATAVNLSGDVTVLEGDAWQTVQEGQVFSAGDRLKTGENSTLQLALADGSSIALGADSDLTLAQLSSGAEGSVTLLSLASGLLDAIVQKLKLGSRFEIQTPTAVAAVKGTDFEVSGADTGSAVTVNEGVVQFGDAGRQNFEPIRPMQRGYFQGGRLLAAADLSPDQRRIFIGRWARARYLHRRRRELLLRFRPMRRRFFRNMLRRRAWRARHGGWRGMQRRRRFRRRLGVGRRRRPE